MSPLSSPRILASLKSIDVHPKVNEDFAEQTSTGGVISAAATVATVLLFLSELRAYMTVTLKHELLVDTARNQKININFDISFPMMPCSWISLDAMDISGELRLDLEHEVYRRRLNATTGSAAGEEERHDIAAGKNVEENDTCGSCYGMEDASFPDSPQDIHCCNSCEQVHAAYAARGMDRLPESLVVQCRRERHADDVNAAVPGEGCQLRGTLRVNKVAGNFHFAPGHSYQRGAVHVHDLKPFEDKHLDFTHRIHHLSFGFPYPGMQNPLDDVTVHQRTRENPENSTGMFQYFLKVVPTTYFLLGGKALNTNQYSVTEHFQKQRSVSEHQLPGVFFFYDLSPIKVHIAEQQESFAHFLTEICAITGGIFTVSGLIDAIIFHSHNAIVRKVELGKFH